MTAIPRIDAILASNPQLGEHSVAPPALRALANLDRIEAEVSALCRPGTAPRAYALLGNVLVRQGRYVDALEAYRTAADLDPADALAHLACAEIAHALDDLPTSRSYRAKALALQRVYPDPLPVGERTPVLLLLRDAPYSTNTPLELIADRSRVAIHKYYLEGENGVALPAYALAFCAFGMAEEAAKAIARARHFLLAAPASMNDPSRLFGIARERLASTLRGIDGVRVSAARVVARSDLAAIALPALIRPLDTQAGEGFGFVVTREDCGAHIDRFPAERYHVFDFVDARGADGLYRKFRAIFVDGVAYPYHLAIAPQWMVHYQSSPMREHARLRDEELAFLREPMRYVRDWERTMPAIARAVGLDYFGIDATVLPDGGTFVFEADAAMLVHDEDSTDVLSYKRPYVARIREALHDAIARRTRRETP